MCFFISIFLDHASCRSEETDDDRAFGRGVNSGDANERTSLLSPPGQGSSEYLEHSRSNRYSESHRSNRRRQKQKSSRRNQRGHLSGSRQRENETTDPRMNTGGHSGIMDNSKENRVSMHSDIRNLVGAFSERTCLTMDLL